MKRARMQLAIAIVIGVITLAILASEDVLLRLSQLRQPAGRSVPDADAFCPCGSGVIWSECHGADQ